MLKCVFVLVVYSIIPAGFVIIFVVVIVSNVLKFYLLSKATSPFANIKKKLFSLNLQNIKPINSSIR